MRTAYPRRGVHHVQLAYAPYSVFLATFEITSLLGGGTRGEGNQRHAPSKPLVVVGAEGEI